MALTKNDRRQRIRNRIRKIVSGTEARPRLSVFRSNKEIYAQVIDDVSGKTISAASSRDKDIVASKANKSEAAALVGKSVAEKAMKAISIKPIIKPIRGGTDGSQLSFMGLPCPNIFAGGHNFHGKYEYVPVESIIKASEVIVKIAELTAVP